MNFFDAKLIKAGKDYGVELNGVKFELTADAQAKLKADAVEEKEVILGVRPEHITLIKNGGSSIKSVVKITEMMGSEAHVHVILNGKDVIIRVQTLGLDKDIAKAISSSGEIAFTFSPEVMHLFDKEKGTRLI